MLTGEDKKIYKLSEKFSYVKTLFVAVEGFDNKSLHKLNQIKEKLSKNPEIKLNNSLNNKELKEYKKQYRFYLNDLNYSNIDDIDIKKRLTNIYNEMISSPFYFNIDQTDPLGIIKNKIKKQNIKQKNGQLILEDYGYIAFFTIESKTDENSRIRIYNFIQENLKQYKDIKYFSTIFFYVENSQVIQKDAALIIKISMILLGLLYLVVLKNIYLFINIAATLFTSVIAGQLVTTYMFNDTSIIALAFSTAITSVSIDYMFHHYLHNYYHEKLGFNKSVFYGFLTTISAFILISFINFPLIKQISIFTIVSLSIAYIHFAFVYPYIKIKHVQPYTKENFKSFFTIKGEILILISIIGIIIVSNFVKFDFNVKNLDYQNIKLKTTQQFFRSKLSINHKIPVIINATNINDLISNAKAIKQIDPNCAIAINSLLSQKEYINRQSILKEFNFEELKNRLDKISLEIGFKKDYFKNSYSNDILYPSYPKYTKEYLDKLGFNIIYDNNQYISSALISKDKLDQVLALGFTRTAQSSVLFSNSLKKVYNELILYGGLTLLLIISILAIVTKKRFIYSFIYIIFPAFLILIYGCFVPLNIMHIFMLFIVLAIGIDYGIYMNEPTLSHNTTLAIIYSLISTFAGFGVLALSQINSLYSIGMTAIIGIFGILFLLIFQYRKPHK
jgi:predicted RND superfamily exporter protein